MSSCGGFDSTSASLCLIVGSVVGLGLHLDVEFILVRATGDWPLQRGERGHRDAVGRIQKRVEIMKIKYSVKFIFETYLVNLI